MVPAPRIGYYGRIAACVTSPSLAVGHSPFPRFARRSLGSILDASPSIKERLLKGKPWFPFKTVLPSFDIAHDASNDAEQCRSTRPSFAKSSEGRRGKKLTQHFLAPEPKPFSGARTKNRTWNLDIKSVLLCQLSYAGAVYKLLSPVSEIPSEAEGLSYAGATY